MPGVKYYWFVRSRAQKKEGRLSAGGKVRLTSERKIAGSGGLVSAEG